MNSPHRDVSDSFAGDADSAVDSAADSAADSAIGAALGALTVALLRGESEPETDLPERAARRVAHTVAVLREARAGLR
ncbi:MAG: hypothetical protein GX868_11335 [Actinobacteria bacterium]|nr:hypothetical protein [Actinomycetota bacterium]